MEQQPLDTARRKGNAKTKGQFLDQISMVWTLPIASLYASSFMVEPWSTTLSLPSRRKVKADAACVEIAARQSWKAMEGLGALVAFGMRGLAQGLAVRL